MLNKPKFMIPSTNVQECTVDADANTILFSCIIDGNEAIYAWRINIYNLEDNSLICSTKKVSLDNTPFIPIDEKNRNIIFQKDLKEYCDTIFSNSPIPYYWTIEFWNSADKDKDKATVLSCEEVFYANKLPEITISYKQTNTDNGYTLFSEDNSKNVLNASKYSFKATYKQNESVALKRYGWKLTDIDSGYVLLDTITQNQIYGTADNILCSFGGFLNNCNYSIELLIETQNNVVIVTSPIYFSVEYSTTFLTNDFLTEILDNEAAVRNSWGDSKIIEGKGSKDEDTYVSDYPIDGKTSAIRIGNNEIITYDYNSTSNLDINEDCYIVLSTQLLSSEDTTLFFAEGLDEQGNVVTRKLSFESGMFIYTINNSDGEILEQTHTPSYGYSPCKYVWYIITMAPFSDANNLLTVVESRIINALYPKENVYPSDALYPIFGEWDKMKQEEGVSE